MINSIDSCFEVLIPIKKKALMPYLTMGYPDFLSALEIIPELVNSGADILELGVPIMDAMTDGPVIQTSSHRSIENGMNLLSALAQIRELSNIIKMPPVAIMTYTNLLFNFGFDKFAQTAKEAGVCGVIVPDMPLEESTELRVVLEKHGIYLIYMMTPNLSDEKIAAIAKVARGFIYMVSAVGTTGERKELPDTTDYAARIRRYTNVPLALGFGISSPQQTHALNHIDGIIIGSALIKRISDPLHAKENAIEFLSQFTSYAELNE